METLKIYTYKGTRDYAKPVKGLLCNGEVFLCICTWIETV